MVSGRRDWIVGSDFSEMPAPLPFFLSLLGQVTSRNVFQREFKVSLFEDTCHFLPVSSQKTPMNVSMNGMTLAEGSKDCPVPRGRMGCLALFSLLAE